MPFLLLGAATLTSLVVVVCEVTLSKIVTMIKAKKGATEKLEYKLTDYYE